MAFKSKAQIFGDNGGAGLQVPVSTSNPPGTAAANRGIGFGEAVTSAIANRAAYALADNTDDLNARMVDLEGAGLDGAYRPGDVAGDGRVITIDGGAVEVVSDDDPADEARALLRARMGDPDDAAFRTGFEVVGVGSGFRQRTPVGFNGDTVISEDGVSATLNPASAGAGRIQVSGGDKFATSGDTDILLGIDFILVSGAGAFNGLYSTTGLISNTVIQVSKIDGTSPGFSPNASATITVVRPTARVAADAGLWLAPLTDGSPTGVNVIFKEEQSPPGAVISVQDVSQDGSTRTRFGVAATGTVSATPRLTGMSSRRDALQSMVMEAGLNIGDAVVMSRILGKLYIDEDGLTVPASAPKNFVSFEGVEHADENDVFPAAVTFSLGNRATFAVDHPENVLVQSFHQYSVVRLSGTSSFDGYYFVQEFNPTGNGYVELMNFDGEEPTLTGSGTLHRVRMSTLRYTGLDNSSQVFFDVTGTQMGKIFGSSTGVYAKHITDGDAIHRGMFIVASPLYESQNPHGFNAGFYANGDGAVAKSLVVRHTDKQYFAFTETEPNGSAWRYSEVLTAWQVNSASVAEAMFFKYRPPAQMVQVDQVAIRIKPSATGGTRPYAILYKVETNPTTGVITKTTIGSSQSADNTTNSQLLTFTLTPFNLNPTDYMAMVVVCGDYSGASTDEVYSVIGRCAAIYH